MTSIDHAPLARVQVIPAKRFWQRLGGLLVRAPLAAGQALHLEPCNSVHTCFMRYAIDVVFLDAQGRVMKIVPHLAPWRLSACRGAHSCLELRAGEAERLGLRAHDRLPASFL